MKNWFQAFAFKFNLSCYTKEARAAQTADLEESADIMGKANLEAARAKVGGCTSSIQLTHSFKRRLVSTLEPI